MATTKTRKPSLAQLTKQERARIERLANEISSEAKAIGTAGQADKIAALPPLAAAYVAIRCFLVRLGTDDGGTAHGLAWNLLEYGATRTAKAEHSGTSSVTDAAAALLRRIEGLSTDEFAQGAEKEERENLRDALIAAGHLEFIR